MTLEKVKVEECSICKDDIEIKALGGGKTWELGHNAYPVTDGRCCSNCNSAYVMTARLLGLATVEGKDNLITDRNGVEYENTIEQYTLQMRYLHQLNREANALHEELGFEHDPNSLVCVNRCNEITETFEDVKSNMGRKSPDA